MPVTTKKTPKDSDDLAKMTFEEAIGHLEEIIERVEQGKVGIERALTEYERGVKLVGRCKDILNTVEQRIEELGAANASKPGAPE